MAKSSPHTAAPHEFPYWPLECLLFYHHAMRDLARYTRAVSQSTDAMQTLRAEGDYGLRLWQDTMQAYYDLALLPMSLAAKAAATAAEPPRAAAE